jgi:hypothetical protein
MIKAVYEMFKRKQERVTIKRCPWDRLWVTLSPQRPVDITTDGTVKNAQLDDLSYNRVHWVSFVLVKSLPNNLNL